MRKLSWFRDAMFGMVFVTVLGVANFSCAADKGTADQAVALVKNAISYIKAHGKEKAFTEFQKAGGDFHARDLYIFVNDLDGNTLAHGANLKLVGKNMEQLRDADGKLFIKEFGNMAKTKGSGWVNYKWPNPVTKQIEGKATYVERLDDIYVGCGIYK